jgi:hypothetical protein
VQKKKYLGIIFEKHKIRIIKAAEQNKKSNPINQKNTSHANDTLACEIHTQ